MESRSGRCSPTALAISGLDPSGGAGLLADVRAFARYRVHGLGVATCLTVQSHRRFVRATAVDASLLAEQLACVFADEGPAATKIGLLIDEATVDVVAKAIDERPGIPVVLDPVASASAGGFRVEASVLTKIKSDLLPLCTVVTPNLDELALLAGRGPVEAAAQALLVGRIQGVLVKGGQAPAHREMEDLLVTRKGTERIRSKRHEIGKVHGTGCALSSAIAALLALDRPLESAVRAAIADLNVLLSRSGEGREPGQLGRLPLSSE